jgi:hypothetical protein
MGIEPKKIAKALYGNDSPWHCLVFGHGFLKEQFQ